MKGAAFDVNNGRAWFHSLGRMSRFLLVASLLLGSWTFTGCGVRNEEGGTSATSTDASKETASTPPKSDDTAEILLFGGTGSSPNDAKAFEAILKDQHVNYTKANSSQLNGMSESRMRGYRLLRRGMTFATPVSADTAYAWTLIQAALKRESLAHF